MAYKTPQSMWNRVAGVRDLGAMTQGEARARTCSGCDATFKTVADKRKCEGIHRKQKR